MSKKKQPKDERPAPARFAVGTLVRVTPGTTVPDFDDIPLGGWAGTVIEVDRRAPATYLIEWNRHTLRHMHPVYRKRCERDGLGLESMWLGEDDLVADDGSPAVIEQPTGIRTRPLDMKDQDDRIRVVFGLTGDDPLPDADEETLRTYHRFLKGHLRFPFAAEHSPETGFRLRRSEAIQVVGLADEIDETCGLLCEARKGKQTTDVPLGEVEVKEGDPNRRLVADYGYWFGNW